MLLGVMDDALLGNVPDVAFADVEQLHPQVIRYDLSWAHTAPRKPAVRDRSRTTRPTTGRGPTRSSCARMRSASPCC